MRVRLHTWNARIPVPYSCELHLHAALCTRDKRNVQHRSQAYARTAQKTKHDTASCLIARYVFIFAAVAQPNTYRRYHRCVVLLFVEQQASL
jgi:hypothetical protein